MKKCTAFEPKDVKPEGVGEWEKRVEELFEKGWLPDLEAYISNLLLQERAKWKQDIDQLIADEMCICHQERTPTSRLTSLAAKIDKL